MAYIEKIFRFSRSSVEGPFEFRQYFEQIKNYGNVVNISRATVPFVVSGFLGWIILLRKVGLLKGRGYGYMGEVRTW